MKMGLVHSDYPFRMEPRVEVKIREGLHEGISIGTPNISYEEMKINDSYVANDKYVLLDKEHLWKRFLSEYKNNLHKLNENVETFGIPTDETGIITDFSWINEKVYLGGTFLEGCLHNSIRNIQVDLLMKGKDPTIYLIPEITLCFLQPAQVTFMEEVNEMNNIPFYFRKGDKPDIVKDKIKLKRLEEVINNK